AYLSGANLNRANLSGTDLSGADLRGAKNWTSCQLSIAIINEKTKLPTS
ncbi:MAG: pentapeptide repeat-containing protein, partial [Deltaproteobacteria bacterium]|nr:pentapeptide repeat-containing protein [Deltaproteobacteria bacterium]